MADTPRSSPSSLPIVIAAVALVLACGLGFFLFQAGPRVPGPPPGGPGEVAIPVKDPGERFSVEEKRELLKLSHQAIGHLENEREANALSVLEKINEKFPEDPFAARNAAVAISRSVQLPNQAQKGGVTPEQAEVGVERLLKAAPNDPISYILAGFIAGKVGNSEVAIQRFRKAIEVDPKSALGWYSLYEALRNSGRADPDSDAAIQLQAEQKSALGHVLELLPDNLRAHLDMLTLMIDTRDPAIAEQLKKLQPYVATLSRASQERFGAGLENQYQRAVAESQKAAQAKTPEEWSSATGPIRMFKNPLIALDPVHYGMAKLKPNELDFLQFQFQSPALRAAEIDAAEFHPEIPVKFAAAMEQVPDSESPLDAKVADYDLDHRPDVWVLTAGKLRIYGTTKESAVWKQLAELPVAEGFNQFATNDLDWDDLQVGDATTPQPEPAKPEPAKGGVAKPAADRTNVCHQADCDLILYGPAGIRIWKNQAAPDGASRSWVQVDKTGLEGVQDVTTLTAADIDHDGDLDLAVGTPLGLQLWSNRENFTFKDIGGQSQLPEKTAVRQIIAVDWDRDVDLDLIVIGIGDGKSQASSGVMLNQLHGVLEWNSFVSLDLPQITDGVRQATLLDADRNVSWDLLAVGQKDSLLALTSTHSAGQTKTLRVDTLADVFHHGACTFDYDNDGILDLLSWEEKRIRLHRGALNDARFAPQLDQFAQELPGTVTECLPADLDRDGDLDLLVLTSQGLQVLANDGGNKNHWLDVRVCGRPIRDVTPQPGMAAKRVNYQAIGSLLELESGGFYLPQVVGSEVTHFGLGQRTAADLVRVVWTNGVPQGLIDVKGDWEITEEQAPKGSCPFAYTWDGERFSFFTDLLWNAPLGLQFAEGVLAPSRQWEYLKIPGHRMVPKGDKYVLQITEELWEATYFDQIELLAVDHPADVEIYSNEKVGPPQIAEFKIHTVKDPRPVVAAHDQRGRDVLTEIAAEDGEFTKSYDRILRQGLTTVHWLELDLGPFQPDGTAASGASSSPDRAGAKLQAEAITLFLTGWMYPTETSISVAVSQNTAARQARPPALWIPDTKGNWQEVRPFMGFPGGKTKTIAIDLTGVFPTDDHRVRIVTNMQFHWDQAFFSVGEAPAEVRTHPLRLESADLHYRGLSRHYWQAGNGPDQYDYSTVLPGPEWPPMRGMFTRYGDVRELLTQSDDRLAIIGAGDEITVTFALPDAPLPDGWKRDFILHNVGWDKDADLNTVYGQTVEPLPFNAMSGYPYSNEEGPPDTPEYRDYLQKYQTRVQDYSQFWRRVRKGRIEK